MEIKIKSNHYLEGVRQLALYESYTHILKPSILIEVEQKNIESQKRIDLLLKKYDIEARGNPVKSGNWKKDGKFFDYIMFELHLCRKAPALKSFLRFLDKKMVLSENESKFKYQAHYFLSGTSFYGIDLSNGEIFIFKGAPLGHSWKESDNLNRVGINFSEKITFETIIHEMIHLKLPKDKFPDHSYSEINMDKWTDRFLKGMNIPLKKSIWYEPDLKEEHLKMKPVFESFGLELNSVLKDIYGS